MSALDPELRGSLWSALLSIFTSSSTLICCALPALLAIAGALQWRARYAPCPIDPRLAAACMRTRRISFGVYALSLAIYAIGVLFAFVLPLFA